MQTIKDIYKQTKKVASDIKKALQEVKDGNTRDVNELLNEI